MCTSIRGNYDYGTDLSTKGSVALNISIQWQVRAREVWGLGVNIRQLLFDAPDKSHQAWVEESGLASYEPTICM